MLNNSGSSNDGFLKNIQQIIIESDSQVTVNAIYDKTSVLGDIINLVGY